MKHAVILSTLLGVAASFGAAATELKPREAGAFILGTHTALVYYTVDGNEYEVVTTIASNDHDAPGAPARFVASMLPGQTQTISVGAFGIDVAPAVLEVVRTGDLLSARLVGERLLVGQ